MSLNEKPWVDLTTYDISNFDRGKPNWVVMVWWLVQAIAFPLSLHNFNSFRCWLLRLFGAKIGKGVVIRPSARFTYPWKVAIGEGSHDFTDRAFALICAPINIGNGTWIATDCFISLGVNIGGNSVIGARSSVMKSISSQQVAWGSPCVPRYGREIKSEIKSSVEI